MNAVPKYDSLLFNEAALKSRTRRQEILANNLANSDTPGFKARDIDFAKTLEDELTGKTRNSSSITLVTTHQAHIAIKPSQEDPSLLYRIPSQPSMDGNTVDGDLELSQFTKNSVFTEAALTFLGGTIRSRLSAITGQSS
jgi:flagellar basal-body rod protein FlgB